MSKLTDIYGDPREKGRFQGYTMPSHEFITAGDSTRLKNLYDGDPQKAERIYLHYPLAD